MDDESQLPDDQLPDRQEPDAPDDDGTNPLAAQIAAMAMSHATDVADMAASEPVDTSAMKAADSADIEALSVSVSDMDTSEPPTPDVPPSGLDTPVRSDAAEVADVRAEHDRDLAEMPDIAEAAGMDGDGAAAPPDDGGDDSYPLWPEGDGDSSEPAQQLMDSDIENRNKMSEMLIEHARRLDEITRGLESERL